VFPRMSRRVAVVPFLSGLQFDGMSYGGSYMLDAAGAFVDPVLPLRVGPCTEVCPQDVMAEISQDALQLHTVKCAMRLASASHELAVLLSSGETPNLPGTNQVTLQHRIQPLQCGIKSIVL